jgi:hypothetical protein
MTARNTPFWRAEEVRKRLRKLDDQQLIRAGRAARYMCSPYANFGKPPRQNFVINLEESGRGGTRAARRKQLPTPLPLTVPGILDLHPGCGLGRVETVLVFRDHTLQVALDGGIIQLDQLDAMLWDVIGVQRAARLWRDYGPQDALTFH